MPAITAKTQTDEKTHKTARPQSTGGHACASGTLTALASLVLAVLPLAAAEVAAWGYNGSETTDQALSRTQNRYTIMKTLRFNFQAPAALAWAFGLYLGGYGTVIAGDINPVLKGSWPGFKRGPATAVAISGNYAYVATSGGVGLEVIDISNPSSPQPAGGCNLNGCLNCAASVAVSGHFAYLATGYGLDVIDIANPVDPQRVGGYEASYEAHWYANGVAVSGHFAYVTDRRLEGTNWIGGLQVFDVSNPADPQRMGWCASRMEGRELVVLGNYAYVTETDYDEATHQSRGGLEVFDVSSPAGPKQVGWYDAGTGVNEVALSGNYAYVSADCLQVIDISDPANPKRVGEDCSSGHLISVAVSGHYAYVGTGGGALEVIDISDPAHPKRVGGSNTGGSPVSSVAVSGNFAYVAVGDPGLMGGGDAGLQVIDISDPANPQRLGVNDTNGMTVDVARSGNYAYVAEGYAGLKVIDVSNAGNPRNVSEYHTIGWAEQVTVSAKYAYVTERKYAGEYDWVYGLEIVDVSNPANPKHVGWYDAGTWAGKAALSGNYAYLAGADGLQVIDISQPASPRQVGRYAGATNLNPLTAIRSIAVAGDHAYVVNRKDGLLVLDVSNPANIGKVGEYRNEPYVGPVAVSGAFACLAYTEAADCCNQAGLQVIDISNPSNPLLVGQCSITKDYYGFWPYGMAIAGNYVYLALVVEGFGDAGRLVAIDISDPSHPQQVGGHAFAHANGVAVSGNQVYLANGSEGLLILEMQPFVKSIAREGQDLKLSWEGFGLARLQRATRLTNPDWSDLPGSAVTNYATLPIDGANAFFRLVKP
jgi:hypothetical protein